MQHLRPCKISTSSTQKLQHHLAAMRLPPMLDEIDSLPGAERELAASDRNVERDSGKHGFYMRRHVIRSFRIVHPAGIVRRQAAKRGNQVGAHVGIGVLLNEKGSRGVAQIEEQDAL